MEPCPNCGSTETPKFSPDNAWCVACVHAELADQRREDTVKMHPQVFHA